MTEVDLNSNDDGNGEENDDDDDRNNNVLGILRNNWNPGSKRLAKKNQNVTVTSTEDSRHESDGPPMIQSLNLDIFYWR